MFVLVLDEAVFASFDISLKINSINNALQYLTFIIWLGFFSILFVAGINYYKILCLKKVLTYAGICLAAFVALTLFYRLGISSDEVKIHYEETGVVTIEGKQTSSEILIIPDFTSDLKNQLYTIRKHFKSQSLKFVVSKKVNVKTLVEEQSFDIIILYGRACGMLNNLAKSDAKVFLFCPPALDLATDFKRKSIAKIYLKHSDENGSNFIWENHLADAKKIIYIK